MRVAVPFNPANVNQIRFQCYMMTNVMFTTNMQISVTKNI